MSSGIEKITDYYPTDSLGQLNTLYKGAADAASFKPPFVSPNQSTLINTLGSETNTNRCQDFCSTLTTNKDKCYDALAEATCKLAGASCPNKKPQLPDSYVDSTLLENVTEPNDQVSILKATLKNILCNVTAAVAKPPEIKTESGGDGAWWYFNTWGTTPFNRVVYAISVTLFTIMIVAFSLNMWREIGAHYWAIAGIVGLPFFYLLFYSVVTGYDMLNAKQPSDSTYKDIITQETQEKVVSLKQAKKVSTDPTTEFNKAADNYNINSLLWPALALSIGAAIVFSLTLRVEGQINFMVMFFLVILAILGTLMIYTYMYTTKLTVLISLTFIFLLQMSSVFDNYAGGESQILFYISYGITITSVLAYTIYMLATESNTIIEKEVTAKDSSGKNVKVNRKVSVTNSSLILSMVFIIVSIIYNIFEFFTTVTGYKSDLVRKRKGAGNSLRAAQGRQQGRPGDNGKFKKSSNKRRTGERKVSAESILEDSEFILGGSLINQVISLIGEHW